MTRRFDCDECGRSIISFGYDVGFNLCGACLCSPSWWQVPEIAAILDPSLPAYEPSYWGA